MHAESAHGGGVRWGRRWSRGGKLRDLRGVRVQGMCLLLLSLSLFAFPPNNYFCVDDDDDAFTVINID